MPKALISVYDKTGIVEFVRELQSLGWEIISSGGTANQLAAGGIKVTKVEEITGFPEIMDNRVKTLHPKIHGGILADRSLAKHLAEAEDLGIEMIDMVVVNLYPFAEVISRPTATLAAAIYNIDIGGPAMLRAAAKNWQQVTAVSDPADYQLIVEELKAGGVSRSTRKKLAIKVFSQTSDYDRLIASYFFGQKKLCLTFDKVFDLRYGENPHQSAILYQEDGGKETSIVKAEILHGKELSYNNIMDADAALDLIKEFDQPAAAVIKHTNPCGCALAENIDQAFSKAYAADNQSAFGGVIVLNRDCTIKIARYINQVFAEMVLAPDFEPAALAVLKQKKNIRLIKLGTINKLNHLKDYRKIVGGMLEQDLDRHEIDKKNIKVVTKNQPDKADWEDMLFAWRVVKHVKSNAIVVAGDLSTSGIGAGQMSRVESVEIAIAKAGDKVKDGVCASDAFFPFRDSVDRLASVGVKAIIQPGGSIKDQEVISAADEHGLAMVFTGVRAFKH